MLCWFLPFNNMNLPKVYIYPLLLEPPQPQGAAGRAPCVMQQLATGHMVIYLFQCCCLGLSHPLLPWLRPQVCSLCPHLCACLTDRFISTVSLDSMCMC